MNQLTLNYEPIKKTANRDFLRENFTRGAEEIYNIPFKKLEFRDGFNKRRVYNNIEHLAGLFKAKGISPLRVDVLPDGRVLIERGHRSYKAIELMIKEGQKVETVPCYINSKDVTEQERMEAVYTSNMGGEKLHAIEQSDVVFALKHNFGDNPSNEELGKRLGISRQQVDNLLLLAEADDATKQEMLNGDLGIVEAISYLRNQKKAKKQSEKTEEDSHKTSLLPTAEPKDSLAGEIKELKELEKETDEERDIRLLKEQAAQEKAFEALLEISDEVKVNKLNKHFGKKLSADVKKIWQEDFIDEVNGEVVGGERTEIAYTKGTVIDEQIFNGILAIPGVKTVFVYKEGCEPVAASVITEPVAEKEKDKYDKDRPEVAQIQNVIKLLDKIEAVVNKIDCPEQTKLDLAKYVQWAQKDAAEAREWIHKNKKQNKR